MTSLFRKTVFLKPLIVQEHAFLFMATSYIGSGMLVTMTGISTNF